MEQIEEIAKNEASFEVLQHSLVQKRQQIPRLVTAKLKNIAATAKIEEAAKIDKLQRDSKVLL